MLWQEVQRDRATLEDAGDAWTVTAARAYNRGQTIFSVSSDALLTPTAAYGDKDLGPPLRDLARQAGPGFDVVAVAGLLAAERVRKYRARADQGLAPESAGTVVPSTWGPVARRLWAAEAPAVDPSVAPLVEQAVSLLLPLLEVAARRAFTAPAPVEPKGSAPANWRAMLEDGAGDSWSRGELERVARSAMYFAIDRQRAPPPFGTAARPAPGRSPPTRSASRAARSRRPSARTRWRSPPEALVNGGGDANAALASFAGKLPSGEARPALVVVATRDIAPGDAVVAVDPWA
ncbi:hypothetical protein JL722_6044 [Aureococcus anophagefferens]|nr:hypothetical protein JL722_6044 [Aureococcus anophagefferens]